jgi:hypothetical protein
MNKRLEEVTRRSKKFLMLQAGNRIRRDVVPAKDGFAF